MSGAGRVDGGWAMGDEGGEMREKGLVELFGDVKHYAIRLVPKTEYVTLPQISNSNNIQAFERFAKIPKNCTRGSSIASIVCVTVHIH